MWAGGCCHTEVLQERNANATADTITSQSFHGWGWFCFFGYKAVLVETASIASVEVIRVCDQ
jgi:hypothetical protein